MWAAGVSAPVVTANAVWQEARSSGIPDMFLKVFKNEQALLHFSSFSLPKYSARNENLAHPISHTWQL